MEFDWTSKYGEIIDFLLDWIEDEHMGMRAVAWEDVKEKWNIVESSQSHEAE